MRTIKCSKCGKIKLATKEFFPPRKECTGRIGFSSWCRECQNKADRKWKEKTFTLLHELKINGCTICGYNRCDAALNFHHINPENKKFNLSINGFRCHNSKSIAAELNKCMLLCCNCHQEKHEKEKLRK